MYVSLGWTKVYCPAFSPSLVHLAFIISCCVRRVCSQLYTRLYYGRQKFCCITFEGRFSHSRHAGVYLCRADYYIYFVGVINDNILIVMIWVSDAMQEWSQLQEVELIWPNTFYVEETTRQFKYYSPFIYLHFYPQM